MQAGGPPRRKARKKAQRRAKLATPKYAVTTGLCQTLTCRERPSVSTEFVTTLYFARKSSLHLCERLSFALVLQAPHYLIESCDAKAHRGPRSDCVLILPPRFLDALHQ